MARRGYARLFAYVADNPEVYDLLHVAERSGNPALSRLCERLAPSTPRPAGALVPRGCPRRADNALIALYFAMTEAMVLVSGVPTPPIRRR